MHRRLALLGTTLALSVPVAATAASPAPVAKYPDKVQQQYLKGCTQAARKAGASKSEARTYCRATLKCLQRELSLSEFREYGSAVGDGDRTPPHNRVVKRCAKAAAKAI